MCAFSAASTRIGCAVILSLAACSSGPEPADPYAPRPVRTVSEWELERDGDPLGRMLLLEIEDPSGPIRFYRIENQAGKWVGYVDSSGRVYRYAPFAAREEFCGVYPMQEAIALLFELEGEIGITEAVLQEEPR